MGVRSVITGVRKKCVQPSEMKYSVRVSHERREKRERERELERERERGDEGENELLLAPTSIFHAYAGRMNNAL